MLFIGRHTGIQGQLVSDTTPPWRIFTMFIALCAHSAIAAHNGTCLCACPHACIPLMTSHLGRCLQCQQVKSQWCVDLHRSSPGRRSSIAPGHSLHFPIVSISDERCFSQGLSNVWHVAATCAVGLTSGSLLRNGHEQVETYMQWAQLWADVNPSSQIRNL